MQGMGKADVGGFRDTQQGGNAASVLETRVRSRGATARAHAMFVHCLFDDPNESALVNR